VRTCRYVVHLLSFVAGPIYGWWVELIATVGWAGQAFPLYWLGLGTRSGLLPANLASVEIGHSWRHLATYGVLTAWAVAGLLVAPILLRRAARRESGSSVAARREKVLRQVAG
jgi:ABC-2 type transport system permease protein